MIASLARICGWPDPERSRESPRPIVILNGVREAKSLSSLPFRNRTGISLGEKMSRSQRIQIYLLLGAAIPILYTAGLLGHTRYHAPAATSQTSTPERDGQHDF